MLPHKISKYLAYFKLQIKRAFSYRFEFGIFAILHPLRLIMMYYLWTSIFNYSGAAALGGLTLSEMLVYYITSFVLDTYVGVDNRLSESINKGDILTFFIRPVKIFWQLLAHEAANRLTAFLFHMVPTLIFAIIFLNYRVISAPHTILTIVSWLLAILINYEFTFIVATFTFWTKSYYGLRAFKDGLKYLFSGWLIPITLYPLIIQKILWYTPFPYITFFTNMIFLGKFTIMQSFGVIALQIFWIIALYGLHRIVWYFAKKRFTGVGV